jgi:hypothetical protein
METVVRRDGNNYTMQLQLPKKTHPLFVGEKHGQTYIFKSIIPIAHEEPLTITSVIMGTVCKTNPDNDNSNKSDKKATMTYALTHHEHSKRPKQVAYIKYDYPSIFQVLADTKARPRRCRMNIFGRASVETREPYCKEGGHRALDFGGRGREGSRKNMQLQDQDGNVVLQMVKWDKDQFHVDFSPPFDAFHAFGFALAQFDL